MKPRARSHPWLMLGPSLAVWLLFVFIPLGVAAYQSLFAWDMLTPPTYVGAANYAALAEGGELWRILGRTIFFSVLVVLGSMTLGLALALLLDRPGRFFGFVRGSIFSAYVVSWVAVALLWVLLLDPDRGIAGAALRFLHLPRIGFLTDPRAAIPTLAAVTVWKITGYAMIVFLAGLRSVPRSLHEAAALDGAGAFARFRWVTWPLLRPTAAFVATTSLIVSFQAFDVVRIMTGGGPARATTLFVYAIYEQIFANLSVGKASALAIVYFGVLCVLAGLQLPRLAVADGVKRSWAYVVGLLAAAVWVLPYAWMVVTSLKPLDEITRDPTAPLPVHPQLDAYREVFQQVQVGRHLLVSLAVSTTIGVLQIALALPAGYALAKLRFVGKKVAFGLVVACLLVPSQVTFVSVFLMFAQVSLTNTFAALVVPFAASALGTFLVRQALMSVPDEIIEAARLDGASELTIVYRILAPLLKPTLVSLFLVSFVFHYSDYFWPLVMTTDDTVRTLPLGVALLKEPGSGVRWHVVMAGNVILSLPVLALFALAQKHLIRGVAARA